MKNLFLRILVLTILALTAYRAALAAEYSASNVELIEMPSATYDCLYFTLVGVPEADAVASGNPWFAIPRTDPGYREMFAALLAAQKTGTTIRVRTTGVLLGGTCRSYVGVTFLISNPS